jgi:hypothetical protein
MCSHSSAVRGRMQASVATTARWQLERPAQCGTFRLALRSLGLPGRLSSPTVGGSLAGLYSPVPAPVAELVDAQG